MRGVDTHTPPKDVTFSSGCVVRRRLRSLLVLLRRRRRCSDEFSLCATELTTCAAAVSRVCRYFFGCYCAASRGCVAFASQTLTHTHRIGRYVCLCNRGTSVCEVRSYVCVCVCTRFCAHFVCALGISQRAAISSSSSSSNQSADLRLLASTRAPTHKATHTHAIVHTHTTLRRQTAAISVLLKCVCFVNEMFCIARRVRTS